MQDQKIKRISIRFQSVAVYGAVAAAMLAGMDSAWAAAMPSLGGEQGNTIGSVLNNTQESIELFPIFLSCIAYLFGIVLGAFGIGKIIEHVQSPQQVSVWEPIKRFFAGGLFFALPAVGRAAYNTLGKDVNAVKSGSFNSGGSTGEGLDAMVVKLMSDIWMPTQYLLGAFVYIAAVVLLMIGISRMLKSTQEGPRGPGGLGTMMTFITAGALLSLDSMLGGWTSSLFGSNEVFTFGALKYTEGMDEGEIGHANAVIAGVIAFVAILGFISFIRGWFIIRDVSEGNQQASLMAGLTHLFGGALAVNLGGVINVVQKTLGIDNYGVNFTLTAG